MVQTGHFALACATELAHACDPLVILECVSNAVTLSVLPRGKLFGYFPLGKPRRVPIKNSIKKKVQETVYCICRMPNDQKVAVIRCDQCKQWFNKECMQVPESKSMKDEQWVCNQH